MMTHGKHDIPTAEPCLKLVGGCNGSQRLYRQGDAVVQHKDGLAGAEGQLMLPGLALDQEMRRECAA